MNSYLIASIISAILVLFNLYYYIQRGAPTSIVLCILWAVIALRNFKQYRAKKDENS